MKAEYIDHMSDDLSVVNAARVSFDKVSEWIVDYDQVPCGVECLSDADTSLIKYLARNNHWTPFAHQRFTFECGDAIFSITPTDPLLLAGMVHNENFSKVRHSFFGWIKLLNSGIVTKDCIGDIASGLRALMPVSCDAFGVSYDVPQNNAFMINEETDPLFIDVSLRVSAPVPIRTQCFKHKQGFVENEESRRYISSRPEVFMPDVFRSAPEGSVKQGSGDVHYASGSWKTVYRATTESAVDTYMEMIEDGVCPEQARFILPQGCVVNWIWTGNLASYARFYKERTYDKAQKEVQDLARMVANIIKPLYPVSWAALVEGDT